MTEEKILNLGKKVLKTDCIELQRLFGGGNNSLYVVAAGDAKIVIKKYHTDLRDQRDRFIAEKNFYSLGLNQVPRVLFWDELNRLAAFEFIQGRKLQPGQILNHDVQQAIEWICEIQSLRQIEAAKKVGVAADGCLSFADHLTLLERRVKRHLESETQNVDYRFFVEKELFPCAKKLIEKVKQSQFFSNLPTEFLILSPSDFGFHNALQDKKGRWWFFDFEYAGWDDPAKLVCDFFCQPQVSVPLDYAPEFLDKITDILGDPYLKDRFHLLFPLHQAKWVCILLNEFLKSDASRRIFAGQKVDLELQLHKAKKQLEKIRF